MKRALIPLAFLYGCSLAPQYSEPAFDAACEWKEPAPLQAEKIPICGNWWTIFQDAELDRLEEIALAQNPTLEIAYATMMEAWAISRSTYADFFPQLFLNPSGVNTGTLLDFQNQLPTTGGAVGPSFFRVHQQQYAFPLNATYNADLFGRIQNGYYATEAAAEARTYAFENVKLTLTSNVAQGYYRVRSLDSQIKVLNDTIKVRKDAFDINTARYNAGLVNYSDVSRALNQLETAEADLSQATLLRIRAENALATLLGYSASDFIQPDEPLRGASFAIAPGLPSTLLERRPDVRDAERQLAAQNALIGVALSGYYPQFQLVGTIGFASPDFNNLFNWQARLWSWGYNIAQLVFDAGKTTANVDASKARFLEALGNYIQVVLNAFEEVESSLAAVRLTRERLESLEKATVAARDTRAISEERYLRGLVTYLDVVDADSTLLSNRLQQEAARYDTYQSTIQLIQALGGGFLQPDPAPESDCEIDN